MTAAGNGVEPAARGRGRARGRAAAAEGAEDRAGPTGTQTLERGLALLELAVKQPRPSADLARSADLSRSVAYRLTGTLIAWGFLASSEDGRLRGGPKLLELAHIAQSQTDLLSVSRPHLDALSQATGLAAFLGRRDEDHSVHLLRSQGLERVAVTTQPGTRRPIAETGLGKALLLDDGEAVWAALRERLPEPHRRTDWLDRMREGAAGGVLFQEGPAPDSINAVAAPIRDASGRIAAAISVAAAVQYLDPARMAAIAPDVAAAAAAIGRDLGWPGPAAAEG